MGAKRDSSRLLINFNSECFIPIVWSILYVSIFSYRLWQSTGQPDHRWALVSAPNQGTLPIQQRARNRHQHCQLQQESNLLQNQSRGSASRIYRREKVRCSRGQEFLRCNFVISSLKRSMHQKSHKWNDWLRQSRTKLRKRKEPMNTLAKKIILASNSEMHHRESA